MLNFFSKSSARIREYVSAVMICLTYENQKLTRAHTTVIY